MPGIVAHLRTKLEAEIVTSRLVCSFTLHLTRRCKGLGCVSPIHELTPKGASRIDSGGPWDSLQ